MPEADRLMSDALGMPAHDDGLGSLLWFLLLWALFYGAFVVVALSIYRKGRKAQRCREGTQYVGEAKPLGHGRYLIVHPEKPAKLLDTGEIHK